LCGIYTRIDEQMRMSVARVKHKCPLLARTVKFKHKDKNKDKKELKETTIMIIG
jgi:hypothetical protein